MPLIGTKVGLGPGHIVLDGDSALPPKGGNTAPKFFCMPLRGLRSGVYNLNMNTVARTILHLLNLLESDQ